MTDQSKPGSTPFEVATNAAALIKMAQEVTGLSLLELAVAFTIAAKTCEEFNTMNENAYMRYRLRQKLG